MKNLKIIAVLVLLVSVQYLPAQKKNNNYYFSKTVSGSFEDISKKVVQTLKQHGFGVITEIDMDVKLQEKLKDIKMKPYRILGVCNPKFAYQTLQIEENIGLFLPCKVLIKDIGNKKVEIVMVNPTALMQMLGNDELVKIAEQVTKKFKEALSKL